MKNVTEDVPTSITKENLNDNAQNVVTSATEELFKKDVEDDVPTSDPEENATTKAQPLEEDPK
ncbi:hypothetical protein A2U01_0094116, partial [Trifolium medium]|nr:hypothetical protein [Trifolium medium]